MIPIYPISMSLGETGYLTYMYNCVIHSEGRRGEGGLIAEVLGTQTLGPSHSSHTGFQDRLCCGSGFISESFVDMNESSMSFCVSLLFFVFAVVFDALVAVVLVVIVELLTVVVVGDTVVAFPPRIRGC